MVDVDYVIRPRWKTYSEDWRAIINIYTRTAQYNQVCTAHNYLSKPLSSLNRHLPYYVLLLLRLLLLHLPPIPRHALRQRDALPAKTIQRTPNSEIDLAPAQALDPL
jgi:hypothetical protein